MKNIPLHKFEDPREFSRQDSLATPFEIARIDNLAEMTVTAVPHRHTYYEIFWILGGAGMHYVDFDEYRFLPNTFFFITPGQIHYPEIEKPLSGYVLLFTEDFLSMSRLDRDFLRGFDFFHRIDHPPTLRLTGEQGRPFTTLCEQMQSEYHGDGYGRLVILQSLLQNFLVLLQRAYNTTPTNADLRASEKLTQDYIRLIDQYFIEKQTVQDYAALLGITAGYLTEATHETLGIPASHLIRQRLIVEAKRLLVHSNRTVAEIGYYLNFADPSYFARFFKRESNFSPTQFKTHYREKYLLSRSS
ncbi:MAG: helix-turn-helix domain-containing protein [Ardenticatenaceae bacterium]|nr:helix-turn-helix domain-containing protein [Anaerolineales bacterium]MCB8922886.1 helix-turn-helix domain-containing protein [Ardenticatenaceae bacterium]MCB8990377.1 helix-turn-helix domain-containing protein [Ardenticatenaceae bacterium]